MLAHLYGTTYNSRRLDFHVRRRFRYFPLFPFARLPHSLLHLSFGGHANWLGLDWLFLCKHRTHVSIFHDLIPPSPAARSSQRRASIAGQEINSMSRGGTNRHTSFHVGPVGDRSFFSLSLYVSSHCGHSYNLRVMADPRLYIVQFQNLLWVCVFFCVEEFFFRRSCSYRIGIQIYLYSWS